MKLLSHCFLTACAVALVGCSSTPTKVDHGPIAARSFNFVDRGAKAAPGYTDNRQAIHSIIQAAITKDLAAKGVSRVNTGGDITVGYMLIVGNNATTTSLTEYFGYGENDAALQDKAHKAYSSSKNPNYFEAGTLVIDIVDSKTFKLLKRGFATRPVLRDLSPDARSERIQEVVNEILQDLRIKP